MWAYGVAVLGAIGLASGVTLYVKQPFSSTSGGNTFKTVSVREGPFESRVVVRGDLQAVDNIDIICEVEGATAITELVPEGTFVTKGETLVVLDSSAIRQKLEDSLIEWQRAKADVTTAEEMLEIQKSQNAANLEAADVALQLAQIDLTKYAEGEYPSLLADAKMAVERAETGLKTKQDDLAQTRSLFSKGFVTATEVKTKELDVAAGVRDLTKAKTDLHVLEKYSHQADLASKKNTLAQAEQKLERTKRENAANLSQKTADLSAKRQQLELIERRVARYREQVDKCTIKAPASGLVVYRNDNNRDSVQIQEGATVRERQIMMRLPDTSRMKVVLKINESQISALSLGQMAMVKISSIPNPIDGEVTKISPVADSADRWMNPDRKDYPVDVVLAETPKGLRPGMSAEVSILTNREEVALAMPIGALYSAGQDRYAFVTNGNEPPRPVKVKIGRSNDQDVLITEGLNAGQNVLLLEAGQGKLLLERAGIKVAEAPPAEGDPNRRRRRGDGNGGAPNGNAPQNGAPQNGVPGNAPAGEPKADVPASPKTPA